MRYRLLCPWGKKTLTFSLNSTRLIRTPHYYGQFAFSLGKENSYTRLIRTPYYYGQFAFSLGKENSYTRLIRTPHYYGQFAFSLGKENSYTRLIRTPYYYGQFALSLGKESPYIFFKFNQLNTDTPFNRDTFYGSLNVLINRVRLYFVCPRSWSYINVVFTQK